MKNPSKQIAKLMAPKISGVLCRDQLFVRLDDCRQQAAVWLSGLGGAGKTTLITSYLDNKNLPFLWYQVDEGDNDPATFFYFLKLAVQQIAPRKRTGLPEFTQEHLANIGSFTRLFFRQLFDFLPQPLIIVLDNYQTVSEDALLHEIISIAVDEVPSGCSLILINRHQPPPIFASLQIKGQLAVIKGDELRLNNKEARAIAERRNVTNITDSKSNYWNQQTHGWVAGLVLLLESSRNEAEQTAENPVSDNVKDVTFNYFDREIFHQAAMEVQKFLVTSAFLPIMTIAETEALTENPNAGKILADLAQKNYFTTRCRGRNVFYQYHPLFRDFLLETAGVELGQQDYRAIQQKTANILEKGDDPEQSVNYFLQLEDWHGFERVVKTIARGLLEQGRHRTLQTWFDLVPDSALDKLPWLRYWQGLGIQFIDTQTALATLETAYWDFKASGDSSGAYLAWSDMVFTSAIVEFGYSLAASSWSDEFSDLRRSFPEFESTIVEAQVTIADYKTRVCVDTDPKEITLLEERLLALLNSDIPLNQRFEIGIHLVSKVSEMDGDQASALLAIDRLTPLLSDNSISSTTLCLWTVVEYHFECWYAIKDEDYLSRLEDALTLATTNQMCIRYKLQGTNIFLKKTANNNKKKLDRVFVFKTVNLQRFTCRTHFIYSSYYKALSNVLSDDKQQGVG